MPTPINPDRGLATDGRGNLVWETRDVLVETQYGPFIERQLVGQPNGGIQMRQGPGGVQVFMYNDDPGVFLNERGAPVSDVFAGAAGFDVVTLGKLRRKKQALAKAAGSIEEEFEHEGAAANVLVERGEYRLVELAPGHFQVQFIEEDGRGSPLSATVLTRKAAEKIFEDLAGPAPLVIIG